MATYTLFLQLKDTEERYSYAFNLSTSQENQPKQIFTPEIRQKVQQSLQSQSACQISEANLNRLITAWLEDIGEGYRTTTVTLDLPLLIEANIKQLKEDGNQQLPEPVKPDLTGIEPQGGALPPLVFG
ncbi:MAG: hypothetical protein ACFB4I_11280 [Cyanophyceae cyanobacterium]